MSGFENQTNFARINKMCEMIEGPMTKSALSNKATPGQWVEMLRPLSVLIEELTQQTPSGAPKTPPQGQRVVLRDLVDGANPIELCSIISLCASRLDGIVYENVKGAVV